MKKLLINTCILLLGIAALIILCVRLTPEVKAAEENGETEVPEGFLLYSFGEEEEGLAVTEPEGSLELGTFDFGELNAAFVCLTAELTGAESAEIRLYIDQEEESFARITIDAEEEESAAEEAAEEGAPEEEFNVEGNPEEDYTGEDTSAPAAPVYAALLSGEVTGEHSVRLEYSIGQPSGDDAALLLQSLFFAEDSIPLLDISIDESKGTIRDMLGDIEHETKCYGSMTLHIPAGYQEEYTGTVYEGPVLEEYELDYIRGRGNSTWGRSKKPYRIKLEDKANLLGMGKDKNWVLLANYFDLTMLRNKITYDIAEQYMPEGTFIPESAFVHVFMNGKYLGVYALSEQVRVGKARLDIDDLEDLEDDELDDEELITGGYLLNMESMQPEGKIIKTPRYSFPVDSPEPEYFTEKEVDYITGYLTELENRIYNAAPGEAVAACEDMLDIDSYIDHYLIQELCMNGDGFKSDSEHFYKERGGKIYFGPLWDFDYVSWAGDKLTVEGFPSADWAPWMVPLLQDETFRERLVERWEVLKEIVTDYISPDGPLDRYADSIDMAQRTNYYASSTFLWDEEVPGFTEELGSPITFESELERMRTWISERVAWMDEHITEIRPSKVHVEFRDGDELVYHVMMGRDELLTEDYLPQPMKEGYRLTGWTKVSADGTQTPLSEEDTLDEAADLLIYQAEWEPYDPDTELKTLQFTEEVFEMPSYSYVWLEDLLLTDPVDFDKRYITFSVECDPEDCAYFSDNAISLMENGKIRVTAVCGSHRAECTIVITEEEED